MTKYMHRSLRKCRPTGRQKNTPKDQPIDFIAQVQRKRNLNFIENRNDNQNPNFYPVIPQHK